jgi:hypothetical protein
MKLSAKHQIHADSTSQMQQIQQIQHQHQQDPILRLPQGCLSARAFFQSRKNCKSKCTRILVALYIGMYVNIYNAIVVNIYNAIVVNIYNATVVKFFNNMRSLVHFENRNIFLCLEENAVNYYNAVVVISKVKI